MNRAAVVLAGSVLMTLVVGIRPASGQSAEPTTVITRPDTDRFWLSGQMNVITQMHASFPSPYSGDQSLRAIRERATSRLLTLFTGVRLTEGMEFIFDLESAGGRGISDALGLAGFVNLDVVRNPTLGAAPYVARAMLHHTIALGSERRRVDPGPLAFARSYPARRIEWRVGKFGTADFFDVNAVGSDSRLQFMNWTIDNNGGYDYAADTRGYTWGAIVEYHDRDWALRFGEMLMPKVANGIVMDWNIKRARAENIEFEFRRAIVPRNVATVRLLSYVNHANMGDYGQAVQRFESGVDPFPIIERTREQGRLKYGFGVNVEQPVTSTVRVFGRWGWNEPHHESFAYTEVNDTVAVGTDCSGGLWHRSMDKVGAAVVTNGISDEHQAYLRRGGKGFLLGDGDLSYGREQITETYYTAHVWRGVFASADVQRIVNPGYNGARGPVVVFGGRLHVEF